MQDGNFTGFVELGSDLTLWVQCLASTGAAEAPDSAPAVTVYNPDGTANATYTDSAGTQTDSKTGFYRKAATCSEGNGFDRGTYAYRWAWTISAGVTSKAVTGTFTVV